MKLLLDTHIWICYLLGNPRLSETLQKAIADETNELWPSPISIWETLLLAEKGRIILELIQYF
jgi:PIN domain nuclease of toxin-antitoxin system